MRRLLCVLACLAAASAQRDIPADEFDLASVVYTPPSGATLRVESRLVEVGVVVRDSRGHAAGGLTKDDFEIEDQGKKREIAAFSVENRIMPQAAAAAPGNGAPQAASTPNQPPRLLALVFDDFNMAPAELMPVRAAAKRFLAEGLGQGGMASVFFVSSGQVVPFTADTATLQAAVDRLTVRNRNAGMSVCPYLSTYEAFAIAERIDPGVLPAKVQEAISCGLCMRRDASCPGKVESMARMVWEQARDTSIRSLRFLDGVVKYLAQMQGRRVVVLASSGFISRTMEREREDVINRALKAEVVIHALDAKGLFTQDTGIAGPSMSMASIMLRQSLGTRPEMENNDSLAVLAESTGGLFFHNNNDLALGFHELGLAPEVAYSLAFAPEGSPDNRYHTLKVRLKNQRHYSVQARHGYFSEAAPPPEAPRPERAIDKEVEAADTEEAVPVTLVSAAAQTVNQQPAIHVVLHINTQRLPFTTEARVRFLQLAVIAALFDEHSAFIAGREARAMFGLKPDTFERLASGQNIGLTLPASPGKYRLRCVVQEGNGGKMTAFSREVEVR